LIKEAAKLVRNPEAFLKSLPNSDNSAKVNWESQATLIEQSDYETDEKIQKGMDIIKLNDSLLAEKEEVINSDSGDTPTARIQNANIRHRT
jgi:hypothetical protein